MHHLIHPVIQHFLMSKIFQDVLAYIIDHYCRHTVLLHGSLACVSWDPGFDSQVTIISLDGNGGGVIETDERLVGHGEPLSCDFDGLSLVVGFVNGAISAFGVSGFLRWHGGSVAIVKVVTQRNVIVSAAADGSVKMWDRVCCSFTAIINLLLHTYS